MKLFRSSLRRRIALSLAGMFLLGYGVLTAIWYFLSEAVAGIDFGGAYVCFVPSPFAADECTNDAWLVNTRIYVYLLTTVVLAAGAWSCWLVAGRLLRPFLAVTDTVRRVGPTNLGQRIGMTGDADALKELADALDELLDRVASGYESQRRFSSNASHELRTPLAVQRLLTEVAMDDPAASEDVRRLGGLLLRTNERNEKLIEGLLVLAESDRGLQGKVPVRLDQLAASVLDSHREMAARHAVTLHRDLTERSVHGDPVLLERLLSNLVSNAIAYNHPNGWVEVVVADDPAITVSNTGESVPAESVSSLFEPFRRLTADRTNHSGGSGLGLSIVRSIATAHDGAVQALPRDGGGLIVEIFLPRGLLRDYPDLPREPVRQQPAG